MGLVQMAHLCFGRAWACLGLPWLAWAWQTFLVGQVDEAGQKLVRCAFDCLAGALASIKPGKTMYQDVGKTISKVN